MKRKSPLDIYAKVKAEHDGSIVLFRVGNFYESFHGDAKTLA